MEITSVPQTDQLTGQRTPAQVALDDFASVLALNQNLDLDAALGMAETAALDPINVSAKTKQTFSSSSDAEMFLLNEYFDKQALSALDMARRMTAADATEYDQGMSDVAYAYAGMTTEDVRRMQADISAGDNTAAVRMAQKFYFG